MDIQAALLKEHSKRQCSRIVRYIGHDKKKFGILMKLFFSGEYRVTQRAAWPMSYCVEANPSLIIPYYKKLILFLNRKDVHPAVARNILRLLQKVEIPKKWQGEIMNSCFQFIENPKEAIAIKIFSLTVLGNLAKDYPEILPELRVVIETRWDMETAGFRSRAKKILLLTK